MGGLAVERDAYRLSFERYASGPAQADPPWLRERRTAAMARFVAKGLPGPRDEAWRHTPTGPLTRGPVEPAPAHVRVPDGLLRSLSLETWPGPRAVLVNGRLSPELSALPPGPGGVEVLSLAELLRSHPARLQEHLGCILGDDASVFADLNTAFAEDGAVVIVDHGVIAPQPILVAHVSAGEGAPSIAYARTLVLAGKGSECRIVETCAGSEDRADVTNAVTEILVEDDAFVDHVMLQREGASALHVATLAARLHRDARLADHAFRLGAALARAEIDVRFEGEGGECTLNGLFVVDGSRVSDTHSRIDHARPHCSSRELYKGVLDGRARGVFHGLVTVRPGAQKTDAWQMNKNLLLSREALVHSTPQLEILADDVKCRHGSTTGQIDAAQLFYLRSRGIDEGAARSLLTYAFASDVVQRLDIEPARLAVERLLQAKLKAAGVREALA